MINFTRVLTSRFYLQNGNIDVWFNSVQNTNEKKLFRYNICSLWILLLYKKNFLFACLIYQTLFKENVTFYWYIMVPDSSPSCVCFFYKIFLVLYLDICCIWILKKNIHIGISIDILDLLNGSFLISYSQPLKTILRK